MNRSPVELLALARLLVVGDKGETRAKLITTLKKMYEFHRQGSDWADRLNQALNNLEAATAITRVKGKNGKPTTTLALTNEGRQIALQALSMDDLPPKTTWANLQTTQLVALALGRPGHVVGDIKAEILRTDYGLELGDKPTFAQATDAMAAKLIGLERGQKFTKDNILRKFLHDAGIEVPVGPKFDAKSIGEVLFLRELGATSATDPLDLIASKSVGARNQTKAELGSAILRTWIDRSEPTIENVDADEALAQPESEPEAPPAPLGLEDFARRVVEAARSSPTGWFGDAKVFISHVWKALGDEPALRGMGVADFKRRLIEAHNDGLFELGRADLFDAMDPTDVRESATPYMNAVYHFVRIEETAR
jgi:hypothetical protein